MKSSAHAGKRRPPTQRVPIWTKRWGEIPQPSDEVHCALYYRIRRLRIHDVQQNVNYFIASGPKNGGTQNLFCFRINSNFDETLCLTFLNGPGHSAHRIFSSECSAPRLA